MANTTLNLCPNDTQVEDLNKTICSAYKYPKASFIIYGLLCPMVSFSSLICNLLIISILIKRKVRSTTSVMLIALAISDIFAGNILSPLFIIVYGVYIKRRPFLLPYPLCTYQDHAYNIATVFHMTSVWLTTALGVQRYIVVAYPFIGPRLCNIRNSLGIIMVIFLFSIFMCSPYFFYISYEVFQCIDGDGNKQWLCYCIGNDWNDEFDKHVAFLRSILGHVVPCIILVVTTILLQRKLRIEGDRILQLHADEKAEKMRSDFRHIKRTSQMIVWIVICFLFVEIPNGLFLLAKYIKPLNEIMSNDQESILTMIMVLNFFVFSSYFVNFWIFVSLSEKFRSSLRKLLGIEKILRKAKLDYKTTTNLSTRTSGNIF